MPSKDKTKGSIEELSQNSKSKTLELYSVVWATLPSTELGEKSREKWAIRDWKNRNKPELSISASSSSNSLSLASSDDANTEEMIFPAPETSPEIHFLLLLLGEDESLVGGDDPSPRPLKKDAIGGGGEREKERDWERK